MPARQRQSSGSGPGGGQAFRPSKSNLYPVVKQIFHPATNPGVTEDDANSELDVAAASGQGESTPYVLPQSTEADLGGVRGATEAQAKAARGSTILGWSNSRIRELIAEAVAAVFRSGNRDRIPKSKLPSDVAYDADVSDSLTGGGIVGRTLTLSRRSGSQPVEIQLPETADSGDSKIDLGQMIHEFDWSNTSNAQSDRDARYTAAEYLIFEGWIGASANPDYPFTTAIKRDLIPASGGSMLLGTDTGLRTQPQFNTAFVEVTLSNNTLTLDPRGATSDYGTVRVWTSDTPVVLAQVSRPDPYITEFALAGDIEPPAGDIAGEEYRYDVAIAHADQVSAARITGFSGDAPSGAATVLATLAVFDHAQGSFALPGTINLAAGEYYTARLEVYVAGQTPGTDTPHTLQDRRITAHAPAAAAYHWGAVPVDADDADAAATAARVVFATHDTTTGNALASSYEVEVPDDGNSYQSYLAVKSGSDGPAGFRTGGLAADASWNDPVDRTVSGTAYRFWILKSIFGATHDADEGRIWEITT